MAGGVFAGQNRTAGRGADGINSIGSIKENSAIRQSVQVWGFDGGIQSAEAVPSLLIAGDEEDIHEDLWQNLSELSLRVNFWELAIQARAMLKSKLQQW